MKIYFFQILVVCKNWQYWPLNPCWHWQTATHDILKHWPLLAHGLLAHGLHGVSHGAAVEVVVGGVVWMTKYILIIYRLLIYLLA